MNETIISSERLAKLERVEQDSTRYSRVLVDTAIWLEQTHAQPEWGDEGAQDVLRMIRNVLGDHPPGFEDPSRE